MRDSCSEPCLSPLPIVFPHHKARRNHQLQSHGQPQTRRHMVHLTQSTRRHSTKEERQERRKTAIALLVCLPRPLAKVLVNEQVTKQSGQDDGGYLVVGQNTRGNDLARGLKGEEGNGEDLHPLDRGTGVFGPAFYDVELDEESRGEEGGGLDAE